MTSRATGLGRIGERLDRTEGLDAVAIPVHDAISGPLGTGRLAAVLQGRWLGHPVHPMLTDIPIGCWTSAWLLDVFGTKRSEAAADGFVGLGVLAAVPTVVTGWSDWAKLPATTRRTGVVHAVTNAVATGLYARSWAARRRGDRRRGLLLAHAGATLATAGAYLGGHLTFNAGGDTDPSRLPDPLADPS
ncbi:MAG: DUF2231 domain-containing protein [Acidimicrobiales bacterium]